MRRVPSALPTGSMAMTMAVFAALALTASASGCGGSGSPAPADAAPADGAFLTCATETRALPYQPGMQVTSSAGTFTIKLLDSTPGPPVKGTNTWTLEIDDAAGGAALDGVDLSVTPWMPDHGHGTSAQVGVTPAGSGTYTLSPVYLYMAGFWQIKMTLVAAVGDGGTSDNAVLPICIP